MGHLWLPCLLGSKAGGLTPLLTFFTVRPVEAIRTLTDAPFVTEASVPTPSGTLGCTREKQGRKHALEARPVRHWWSFLLKCSQYNWLKPTIFNLPSSPLRLHSVLPAILMTTVGTGRREYSHSHFFPPLTVTPEEQGALPLVATAREQVAFCMCLEHWLAPCLKPDAGKGRSYSLVVSGHPGHAMSCWGPVCLTGSWCDHDFLSSVAVNGIWRAWVGSVAVTGEMWVMVDTCREELEQERGVCGLGWDNDGGSLRLYWKRGKKSWSLTAHWSR